MPLASRRGSRRLRRGRAPGDPACWWCSAGAPLDQPAVPADAVEERVDTEVLVVRVDRLALRLGHAERREAVDTVADAGEVAGGRCGPHYLRSRLRIRVVVAGHG